MILAGIALRERKPEPVEADGVAGEKPSRSGRIRAAAVLLAFAIIAPLVAIIGYVPAMVLLVLVVLYGIERRRDFRSLVAAVLIPTATYLLVRPRFRHPAAVRTAAPRVIAGAATTSQRDLEGIPP